MKEPQGFTLIELMIVVAIVAILAAVAVPSYQAYVESGRRAEGKAFALDIASRQERFWTQNSTYADTLTGTCGTCLNMPAATSENGYYSGATTGGNTFTITVTPTPADSKCGALTLTNTGVRGSGSGTAAECWR
jgi:type IV pilus assembly protein PilE